MLLSATARKKPRVQRELASQETIFSCLPLPTAAPPTVPVGAPETPRRWVRVLELVKPWPRLLPGIPPPAPLAMGWSTVAVWYHYSDQTHAPTADGSTADGTRRSTGDTQKGSESDGTGKVLAYAIASDPPSSSPGHGVAHSVRSDTHTTTV